MSPFLLLVGVLTNEKPSSVITIFLCIKRGLRAGILAEGSQILLKLEKDKCCDASPPLGLLTKHTASYFNFKENTDDENVEAAGRIKKA